MSSAPANPNLLREALGLMFSIVLKDPKTDEPRMHTLMRSTAAITGKGTFLHIAPDAPEAGVFRPGPDGAHMIEVSGPDMDSDWLPYILAHELAHYILDHTKVTSIPVIYQEFDAEEWTFIFLDEFVPGFLNPIMRASMVARIYRMVKAWDDADITVHPITLDMAMWCGYEAPEGLQCMSCQERVPMDTLNHTHMCAECRAEQDYR